MKLSNIGSQKYLTNSLFKEKINTKFTNYDRHFDIIPLRVLSFAYPFFSNLLILKRAPLYQTLIYSLNLIVRSLIGRSYINYTRGISNPLYSS